MSELQRGDLTRAHQRLVDAMFNFDVLADEMDDAFRDRDTVEEEYETAEVELAEASAAFRTIIDAYEELLPENPLTYSMDSDRV